MAGRRLRQSTPKPSLGWSAPAHLVEGVAATTTRDDGWNIAAGDNDKLVDMTALSQMADRLAAWGANIHAVLVVHRGKLVFERYLQGSDQVPTSFLGSRVENVVFDADTPHAMKSVTKSVASLAVGIAIDRGLIHDVDQPILSFFPEPDLVVAVTTGYYQDYSPQAFKVQYGVFSDALQAVLPPR